MNTTWDFNDRRGWRYSPGGRPLQLAMLFLDILRGDTPPVNGLFTAQSEAEWKRRLPTVDREELRRNAYGASTTVRHPAPDMAYVFFLIGHPDQTEPFAIERETLASVHVVTLLYDEPIHDWKVHAFPEPTPPAELGKESFAKS